MTRSFRRKKNTELLVLNQNNRYEVVQNRIEFFVYRIESITQFSFFKHLIFILLIPEKNIISKRRDWRVHWLVLGERAHQFHQHHLRRRHQLHLPLTKTQTPHLLQHLLPLLLLPLYSLQHRRHLHPIIAEM